MTKNTLSLSTTEICYYASGTSLQEATHIIVIEHALGSVSAEWWHLLPTLAQASTHSETSVIAYDRPGYGKSTTSTLTRTPHNISIELWRFLDALNVQGNITFVGHSQGGLYAASHAMMRPESVRKLILLDPLSPFDSDFQTKLSPDEYAASGVDKAPQLRMAEKLTRFGLGVFFRSLLKKSPPFYYYPHYSEESAAAILASATSHRHYNTALAEYAESHKSENLSALQQLHIDIPLVLLTHSSALAIAEIQQYGGANEVTARKIEQCWQEIMQWYCSISPPATWHQSLTSGHYIHLQDAELLRKAIAE